MASVIAGFEYDIFISYRQKDNKYDGWVTEFVSNLRKELEATFKEDVTIYFDENPHDGIAQYHDVDDSLKPKLKCAVLIPIVSRTYCDPDCYAWKYELQAFVDLAISDGSGLKVTLANGNVGSRILPVRIHDLEKADVALFEACTGSVFRPIDFVFRSAGVNRPLRQIEEHPADNQNHLVYRDQINKVANAVKELIGGLQRKASYDADSRTVTSKTRSMTPASPPQPQPVARRRIAVFSGLLIAFVVAGYLIYYFNADKWIVNEQPGKSIAVLPFENLSGDPTQEYFSDGIAEEILIALAQIKDLKVAGRTSSFRFKGRVADLQEIGEQLKVNTVLEGTVRRQGNRVKISAKLLDVSDGYQLWSEQFERTVDDVFEIQEEIALAISQRLKVTLLENEDLKIGEKVSRNPQAYEALMKGRYFWNKRQLKESEKYFLEAIALDSNYAAAYAGLAETYVISAFFETLPPHVCMPKAEAAARKAIALDSSLVIPYFTIAFKKAIYDWDGAEASKYFRLAFENDPRHAAGYFWYAQYLYNFEAKFERAIEQMRKAVELEPLGSFTYFNLGNGLLYNRQYAEALKAYEFSIQLNRENALAYNESGFCNVALGQWEKAEKDFEAGAGLGFDWPAAVLIFFRTKKGDQQGARKIYDELVAPSRDEYGSQYVLSTAAAFLGEKELAHQHFRNAIEQRDPWLVYHVTYPVRLPGDVLDDPRNLRLMLENFPYTRIAEPVEYPR